MNFKPNNIVVIGASGAIGKAFCNLISVKYPVANLHQFSSKVSKDAFNLGKNFIDYQDENSIARAADISASEGPIDLVIVANGILHDDDIMPEKSLRDLSAEKFQRVFAANIITPALIAKYFLPKLNKDQSAKFAALSARVGSISDNNLGGWYAYRSSKAALNMIIKNAAIEINRRNKQAVIVGLHPGTVDSDLSKPFQSKVPNGKLFTPQYSAEKLLSGATFHGLPAPVARPRTQARCTRAVSLPRGPAGG
ncbi:MAG: SDR family NAD(P)-dependent oxidoreductase, partial [Pseudomonadota bacterium]